MAMLCYAMLCLKQLPTSVFAWYFAPTRDAVHLAPSNRLDGASCRDIVNLRPVFGAIIARALKTGHHDRRAIDL